MIKLTETSRKILRAIYRGVGTAVIALSLTGCPPWYIIDTPVMYGPGPDYPVNEEYLLTGKVISKTTKAPIAGIAIYIKELNIYSRTYSNGDFYYWVLKQDNYTLIFTDIDNGENGGRFKQQIINLTREQIENLTVNPLIIEMELEEDP